MVVAAIVDGVVSRVVPFSGEAVDVAPTSEIIIGLLFFVGASV